MNLKQDIHNIYEEDKILKHFYSIFNNFFLEIIRSFKTGLFFGLYQIDLNDMKKNKFLNSGVKNLVPFIEFNKIYPECISILKEKKSIHF